MTDIEWRTIPGWEGLYEVSEDGQVRSLERLISHPRGGVHRRRARVLKGATDRKGYRYYSLSRDGSTRHYGAHVLVAKAFLDGDGSVVRHRDGNQMNNHPTNLAYGTYSDNTMDSVQHGTHARAARRECVNGHPYTDETTLRVGPRGRWRKCRICVNSQRRAWKQRKRAS